jgi:hypothetical protein
MATQPQVHHSELARLRDEKNEAQRQEHMAKAGEERLRRLVLKAAAASDPKVALDRLAREALMAEKGNEPTVTLGRRLSVEFDRVAAERDRYRSTLRRAQGYILDLADGGNEGAALLSRRIAEDLDGVGEALDA